MKLLKPTIFLLTFFTCLIVADKVSAATCNDQANGNWNSAATWSCGLVPDSDDDVIIDSHTVSIVRDESVRTATTSGGVLNMGSSTLSSYGDWIFVSGTINAGTSKLKFVQYSNTFYPGSASYYDIEINKAAFNNLTISGTANVTHDLILTQGSYLYNGAMNVSRNVYMNGMLVNNSGNYSTINIIGTHDQTIYGISGGLPGIVINKPNGTLHLSGTLNIVGNRWQWISGNIDTGTSTLSMVGYTQTFTPGNVKYYNVHIRQAGFNVSTLGGNLNVTNDLIYSPGNGSSNFLVSNYVITAKNFLHTEGILTMGSGALKVTGNFTRTGGTFTYGTSVVSLLGQNQTIDASTTPTTFYKLYKLVNAADTLYISSSTNLTIAAGGVMRFWGKPEGKTLSIRSTVAGGRYTITKTGTTELEYTDWKDANWSGAVTAAASNDSGNNTNLTVTKEFISTIRATGGDYSLLSTWESAIQSDLATSSTKVFSGTMTSLFADGATAYLCRSGVYQSITATSVHAAILGNQILLSRISNPSFSFQVGDVWYGNNTCNSANYFTIADTGYGAIAVAHPYNDWPTGLDDYINISGWTTNSSNYVRITVPSGQRHNGNEHSGFYLKYDTPTDIYVLNVDQDYSIIEYLEIDNSSMGSYGSGVSLGSYAGGLKPGKYSRFSNNIVHEYYYNGISIGDYVQMYVFNNKVYNARSSSYYGIRYVTGANGLYIYNNTVYKVYSGIRMVSGIRLKNNLSTGNTVWDFNGTPTLSISNASTDSTAIGTSSLTGQGLSDIAFSSINNPENFHITTGSTVKNKGTDLSIDPDFPIIDDIDGETRPVWEPWDIGADEFYPTINATLGGPGEKGAEPVAWYKFDEGFGGVVHNSGSSGSVYDGSLRPGTGGGNTASTSMWDKGGKFGGAMEFDNTDDYVVIPDMDAVDNADSLSVCAWVYHTTLTFDDSIYHNNANPANSGFRLYRSSTGNKYIATAKEGGGDASSVSLASSANSSPLNTWTLVCAVYTENIANGLKLFINGKLDSQISTVGQTDIDSYTSTDVIGGNSVPTSPFAGLLDEVKIFDYALTPDQVKLEYAGGSALSLGGQAAQGNSNGTAVTGDKAKYCVPGDTAVCTPPVLELNMDEKSGTTTFDTSGNGNDGVFATAASSPAHVRGKVGQGLRFDGVDDYVRINNGFDTPSSITISLWVYPHDISSNRYVTSDGNRKSIILGYQENNFNIYGYPTGNSDDTIIPATQDSWQNIVYTSNGTNVRGYKDGQQVFSVVGSLNSGATYYEIGKIPVGTFDGFVDNLRIYNYARTPAQIAWDYNRGKPMAEWRFDEGTGASLAHNSVSNSLHGTMYNMETADWVAGKFNKALDFDGTNEYVDIGDTNLNLNTVSFWINADNLTKGIITLDSSPSAKTIVVTSGVISAPGFTSPTIYVDAKLSSRITTGAWHHVLIKTATAFEAIDMEIGRAAGSYFDGRIDTVKLFSYELTLEQIKMDYSGGAVKF